MGSEHAAPKLTHHAIERAHQRTGCRLDAASAVRVPPLPRGVRLVRGEGAWVTGSALLICRGRLPVVVTVLELPDGLLAAVLCRLAFGVWVLDEADGVALPGAAEDARHTIRRLRIRGPRGGRRQRRGA